MTGSETIWNRHNVFIDNCDEVVARKKASHTFINSYPAVVGFGGSSGLIGKRYVFFVAC